MKRQVRWLRRAVLPFMSYSIFIYFSLQMKKFKTSIQMMEIANIDLVIVSCFNIPHKSQHIVLDGIFFYRILSNRLGIPE
jgi:hypothetical protein